MKIKMSKRFFKVFWLLPISFLMFGNFFNVKAQNSSTTNLEGTTWQGITDFNLDSGDILKIEFTYIFSKNGKVELAFLTFTSGLEFQRTQNNTIQPVFNPMKSTFAGVEVCTYKLTGKSVQIKCPTTGDANATINGNRMNGEISSKIKGVDGKKEKWVIERKADESNSNVGVSNSGSIKRPIEPRTAPSKTGSSTKLKIGTYEIKAITETFQERVTFKIEIESVGANGEVKARVYKDNDEGQLKGRVDSNGQLVLKGSLIHIIKGLGKSYESGFELKATVEDNTLVNGSYREQYDNREFGGTFDKGILEEEF